MRRLLEASLVAILDPKPTYLMAIWEARMDASALLLPAPHSILPNKTDKA